MKTIILAGGRGTRLAEETGTLPKPMVQIGGKPMIWHLMNSYASQGFSDFVIATGYLSEVIDSYVRDLDETWNVETLFTGVDTQTGGRIKQCIEGYPDDEFLATYGDGLANVDVHDLVRFHRANSFMATMTAVRPPARFGVVQIDSGVVTHFGEKLQSDSDWINGGFFVLKRTITDFILSDLEPFETGAIPRLAAKGMLGGFQHSGFWKPMDTLREKQEFEILASLQEPPWIRESTSKRH
jgi:glucose-1-phosphate cytidylyltransferase